ncbi:hypothetical protein ACYOEI_11955, partial [Singulisphaera rosea]
FPHQRPREPGTYARFAAWRGLYARREDRGASPQTLAREPQSEDPPMSPHRNGRLALLLAAAVLSGCSTEKELPISGASAGGPGQLALSDRGSLSNPLKIVGKAKRQNVRRGNRLGN